MRRHANDANHTGSDLLLRLHASLSKPVLTQTHPLSAMDCPKCGTWNPDDKLVCWRCQTPLPKPEAPKKRRPLVLLGLPIYLWLILLLFVMLPFLWQCGAPLLGQ